MTKQLQQRTVNQFKINTHLNNVLIRPIKGLDPVIFCLFLSHIHTLSNISFPNNSAATIDLLTKYGFDFVIKCTLEQFT